MGSTDDSRCYPCHWSRIPAGISSLVHGKGDPNSPFVKLELDEIRQMIEFERQNADVSFMELFKPKMLNRLHIGVFTQVWSQLTGMNVMMVSCACTNCM